MTDHGRYTTQRMDRQHDTQFVHSEPLQPSRLDCRSAARTSAHARVAERCPRPSDQSREKTVGGRRGGEYPATSTTTITSWLVDSVSPLRDTTRSVSGNCHSVKSPGRDFIQVPLDIRVASTADVVVCSFDELISARLKVGSRYSFANAGFIKRLSARL